MTKNATVLTEAQKEVVSIALEEFVNQMKEYTEAQSLANQWQISSSSDFLPSDEIEDVKGVCDELIHAIKHTNLIQLIPHKENSDV